MRVEEGSTADADAHALALAAAQAAQPTPSWVMLGALPRVQKAGLFVKDLQVELLPPPAVSFLTVSDRILGGTSTVPNLRARHLSASSDTDDSVLVPARHPSAGSDNSVVDPCKRLQYPYVVAMDPSGGSALLLCTNRISDWGAVADTTPADGDCPRPRYVLYDTLSDTSTVLMSPLQAGSVGLARRDGAARGQLVVAALMPTFGEDTAVLSYCVPKSSNQWVDASKDCEGRNNIMAWANNGVLAVGSKLFWVDHVQGVVGCNVFSEEKLLSFISFKSVRVRDSSSSTRRRVQAIDGKLTLLQTEWEGGEATLAVYRLMDGPDRGSGGWIHEYSVELCEIWAKVPTVSPLRPELPMVVLADPYHPSTMYILQGTCVFTVDTDENTVAEHAGPCDVVSLEDIYTWELPPSLISKLHGSTGCWDFIAGLLSLVCKPLQVVNDEEDVSRRMMLFFRF